MTNKKQLRVWWTPQVPMEPFYVKVTNLEQANLLLDTLANYDLFQLENDIKPDYNNAGGLEYFDAVENEWLEWEDEDSGMGFDEYREEHFQESL